MASEDSHGRHEDVLTALGRPHFPPDMVAHEVIWPAVEELWGEDWRDAGQPDMPPLQFPRQDNVNNERVGVCLSAETELIVVDDGQEGEEPDTRLHEVVLDYQVVAVGSIRDCILGQAYTSWERKGARDLCEQKSITLVAKKCIAYAFQPEGDVWVLSCRRVTTMSDGQEVWSSSDEDDMVDPLDAAPRASGERLYEDDLQRIGKALTILTGSLDYLRAIDTIKSHPIEDY